jgi:hypothetical protein
MIKSKRVIRTIITILLFGALATVIILSQNHDPTNPHSGVPEKVWIYGPKGHGYVVLNNQQPWKECYPCHEKKGLGGETYCLNCHAKYGVNPKIPQEPSQSK